MNWNPSRDIYSNSLTGPLPDFLPASLRSLWVFYAIMLSFPSVESDRAPTILWGELNQKCWVQQDQWNPTIDLDQSYIASAFKHVEWLGCNCCFFDMIVSPPIWIARIALQQLKQQQPGRDCSRRSHLGQCVRTCRSFGYVDSVRYSCFIVKF